MSESPTDAAIRDTGAALPKRIYNAADEREVTRALEEHSEQLTWHNLGDQTRNYSVVYNQASDPVSALGELIANSIDATLMRRYYESHGRHYDPAHGLNSYDDARELLTGDEEVEIVADGPKPSSFKDGEKPHCYPNLAVLDRGHGQPAEEFEDTLVGFFLPGQQKDEFPFVQGRFGMGGSAVLPHSGDRMYKFIASASMDEPGRWTWTVVRDAPAQHERRFEYLKFGNELPVFTGMFEARQVGTVVRVYDYNFTSNIRRQPGELSSRFIELLDRELVRSPVPIRANERRDDYKNPASANTRGILSKLERDKDGLVKRDLTEHYNFGSALGERAVRIIVLKSDYELEAAGISESKKNRFTSSTLQSETAVFFTRNDQTHGDLGSSFLKTRCKKPRTGKDMLVFADFSEFEPLEDLFKPSRDRLTDQEITMTLKDGLIDLIKNHDWLSEEEERRRNHIQTEERDEERSEIVENIAEENEDFAALLDSGELAEVSDPESDDDAEDEPLCDLGRFPSRLEVLTWFHDDEYRTWTSGRPYTQQHPVNRTQVIQFLLDAHDRYFERGDRPGSFEYTIDGDCVNSWNHRNGILTVRLAEPTDADPGDSREATFRVERHNRTPLQEHVEIEYTEPVDHSPPSPNDPDNSSDGRGLPDTVKATEDGRGESTAWDDVPEEMNERIPVVPVEDGTGLRLFVNHDMSAYRNYVSRKDLTEADKEYVATVWDAGIQLYTTATYYHLQNERDDIDLTNIVGPAMGGVAVTMLDQHIDDDELVGGD
jgi:hypothetical protein